MPPGDQERGTREVLLTAAAAVFARDGYVRATVEEVCRRAGVTKGALYGHFDSKHALATAVLDRQAAVWRRRHDHLRRVHASPLQALVDLGYSVRREPDGEHPDSSAHRMLFQYPMCDELAEREVERWTGAVRDLLRAAAARRELRDGVDQRRCAEGIVTSLVGVHIASMAMDDLHDVSRRVADLWRTWIPAVATPSACAALRLAPPGVRS